MAESKDNWKPIEKKGGYQPTTNPKAKNNPPQGKKSGGTTQGKKA